MDFKGSRFVHCKFAGPLSEVWFRGSYESAPKEDREYLGQRGIDPGSIHNPMDGADFREAELIDVQFTDNIDLSRCAFPQGREYIVVLDKKAVHDRAKQVLEGEWSEDDRKKALDLLDLLVGPGDRHKAKTEEALRATYGGRELGQALKTLERSYASLRAQRMTVIRRVDYENRKEPWSSKLLDVLADICREFVGRRTA